VGVWRQADLRPHQSGAAAEPGYRRVLLRRSAQFVNGRLRPTFHNIWFVGGGVVCAECLRLRLADDVRYSLLPILIGDGISFFEKLDRDVALHLVEVKAYKSGMVELHYEVRGHCGLSS
jgi:dihydrofolate reductase